MGEQLCEYLRPQTAHAADPSGVRDLAGYVEAGGGIRALADLGDYRDEPYAAAVIRREVGRYDGSGHEAFLAELWALCLAAEYDQAI